MAPSRRVAALVDVGQLDRLADSQRAAVRLLLPGDHPEQRGLAGAVGADDADDAAAREVEVEVLDEDLVAVGLAQVLGLDHHVAQARPGRDGDLDRVLALLLLLGQQLVVGRQTRLRLGLPGARRGAHPLELARQRPLPRRFRLLLGLEPLALLLEPRRVVPLPGDAGAAVELEDPAGDVVEEVAIVRDGHDRPRELVQVVLEPGDALGVEMVGRLVEQQHVRALEQHAAERHAAPLAAGELVDVRVGRRQPERVHGDLQRAVEVPAVGRLDRVLQLALLLEQLVHRLGRHLFAELGVHLVEAL